MRGSFTAGVLEAFADELGTETHIFDFVVACSAGVCNAASYLAGQPWRNRRIYLDHIDGGKMIQWRRWLLGKNIMDIDYLMDQVTLRSCPLDLEALRRCPVPLYMGVTDAETGETRYLSSHDDDLLTAMRATCALPAFYRESVVYQGRRYVDGGVSDPVPIRRAMELGGREIVVVLTSSIERRTRKCWTLPGWNRWLFPEPGVRKAVAERHLRYRDVASLLASPPASTKVHVVRPSRSLPVSRATRDRRRLEQACDQGYRDGQAFLAGWSHRS